MNEQDPRPDMLDDPGISRQWVLRRLQKVLTTDLAVAALLTGLLARSRAPWRQPLEIACRRTTDRARLVREIIEREGGAPYSSVGLARAGSRAGGWLLGLLGPRFWLPVLRPILETTYAELDGLAAFAHGAAGVSPAVGEQIGPEVELFREVLEQFATR